VPSINFCCCAVRRSETLCCRYRQVWNHFRCDESDDVVETQAYVRSSSPELHYTAMFKLV